MANAYEVIVSQNRRQDEDTAIANAMNQIATVATDLGFPVTEVFDVNVYDGGDGLDYGIGLCIALDDLTQTTASTFEQRLETETGIESLESVHYKQI